MQRRTILQMVLSSVALCFAPLTALVRKKVPPLRADVKHVYPNTGSLMEVTGTPEQLCAFYHEYQNVLWPPCDDPMSVAARKDFLAPRYKQVSEMAHQSGSIEVILHGYGINSGKPDWWAQAATAAIRVTGCVLTPEAARVVQMLNANIQRPRSCTEERC